MAARPYVNDNATPSQEEETILAAASAWGAQERLDDLAQLEHALALDGGSRAVPGDPDVVRAVRTLPARRHRPMQAAVREHRLRLERRLASPD